MPPEPTLRRWLYGTDEAVPEARALRAGRLEARLRGTRLGPITCEGHEVWHGIDFLFRDPDWGTPAPVVDACTQHELPDGCEVRLEGHIGDAPLLTFTVRIALHGDTLRYEASATVPDDLATNRTGVVLMHPQSAAGRPLVVEHIDGRSSASTFPVQVAPWPPFLLVRAIRHEYADGAWAACRFAGDAFELEDQRNNADASFKTYNRSNLMPRPYTLRAGRTVQQSVELRIEQAPAAPAARAEGPVRVTFGEAWGPLPAIGTAIAAADTRATRTLCGPLAELAPGLLHLVLEQADEAFDAAGLACLLAAGGCALRLDVEGVAAAQADAQLQRLAQRLQDAGVRPASVAVFPTGPVQLAAARRAFPAARIGGGTPHFFTQLNRAEDLGDPDFLSFTTAGVVHGADDEQILHGLHSLPAMLATLRARHGEVPVHVGPSGIAARRSPLGGQPASDGTRRLALARRDPRTCALYGAAWALGYIAQLARAGAQAITLFDLAGDSGLLAEGAPTPAFALLRHLGTPATLRATQVSNDRLAALSLVRAHGTETLLANLGEAPLAVALPGIQQARVMHAMALQQGRPWRDAPLADGLLQLGPFAVACV